jgi:pimeloyl-ACP methyl ester carboxylesterase
MHDYAADVREFALQLARPPGLVGWSIGGLVAMMATDSDTPGVVGLAPSTPERATKPDKTISTGEFGPEEYGITSDDPANQPFMPDLDLEERVIAVSSLGKESRYARGERAAGIVLAGWSTPLLIATGTEDRQWPADKYDHLPMPAERISIDGASHWGLVLSQRALATLVPSVCEWLESRLHA